MQKIKNVSGKKKASLDNKKKIAQAKVSAAKERAKTMFSYIPKRSDVLLSDEDNSDEDKPTREVVSRYTHGKSSLHSSPFLRPFTPDSFSSSEDDTPSQKKTKLFVSTWLDS